MKFEDIIIPLKETPEVLKSSIPEYNKIDLFEIQTILDYGDYGVLVHSRKKENRKMYCMKISNSSSREVLLHTKRITQKCHHPFIARMMYGFVTPYHICTLYENMNGGTLLEQWNMYVSHDWSPMRIERRACLHGAEIAYALSYLHSKSIIYRSISLNSFLLDKNCKIKLFLFDYAKENVGSGDRTKSVVGFPLYMAPEIMREEAYGHSSDIWAYGILMYHLICLDTIEDQNNIIYPFEISAEAREFLQSLLHVDPEKRIKNFCELEFFKHIDWIGLHKRRLDPIYRDGGPIRDDLLQYYPDEYLYMENFEIPDDNKTQSSTTIQDLKDFTFTTKEFEENKNICDREWGWKWEKRPKKCDHLSEEAFQYFFLDVHIPII